LRTGQTASNVICGHAFVQNLRHGHDELGVDASTGRLRRAAAFGELAQAI
jgi:IS6 family transposase